MPATKMVRKLTTKDIIGKITQTDMKKLVADGEVIELYRLGGTAVRSTPKETRFGTSYLFSGDFIAIQGKYGDQKKIPAGTIFQAPGMYAPPPLDAHINAKLASNEGKPVEFSGFVTVEFDESNVGYHYSFVWLRKIAEANATGAILKELQSGKMEVEIDKKK